LAALLSVNGLDFITAISGSASAISNVGPGLGNVLDLMAILVIYLIFLN